MERKQNENRVKAKRIFMDSDGLAKNTEIAEALGVDNAQVRKWKCIDKWKDALDNAPAKRGGQKGNDNAMGHGAPQRNRNAVTHGAYATVYFDELTEEEKTLIESVTLDTADNMLREMQTLVAKENDLKKRIAALGAGTGGELYTDRVTEMRTPGEDEGEKPDSWPHYRMTGLTGPDFTEQQETDTDGRHMKIVLETTTKSSAFERSMKLEAELNKVHGRIIKLIDSIKSYELERRRMDLEEKRYTLMKQKVSGVFDFDPDTGEIEDMYDGDGGNEVE